MRLNKWGYLIREGFRSIMTHGFMSFATVTIIIACLIIMGSVTLLSVNIDAFIADLENENEVVAFVDETYTDEQAKRVVIEPEEAFYSDKVWEWSEKIDLSQPLRISDLGVDAPQWVERRYKEGDYASEQYNEQSSTQIGCWRVGNQVYGALDTIKVVENPLFTTGINKCGVYALAPSASLLQVGDSAAEGAIDSPFTTHIVRYLGLRPLPEGEVWGPLGEAKYPLAAFFFAGDEMTKGFSLCFEPRDGVLGLCRYFEAHAERVAKRQRLVATLSLSPAEVMALLSIESEGATIRDTFRLKLFNESSLYRLESLKNYNPTTKSAECTFIRLMQD